MFDNIAPNINEQMNTNFMEERVLESQLAYPQTTMDLPISVEQEMADGTWMAKHQLMKPVQIGQFTWSVSNPAATDIYTGSFPGMLSTKDSLALQTLRMYSFYKLSPIFRVQINSTPFHQGQLICSFDPFSVAETTITPQQSNYNLFSSTGFPHVRIMASNSDPVELQIPFTHLRSFLTTNAYQTFNNMGTFRITVLNPLKVGTDTSPTVTVTLWVYTNDAEVHVPISDHDPLLEYTEPPTPSNLEATSGKSRIPQLSNRKSTNTKPPIRKPQRNAPTPPAENQPPEMSFGDRLSKGFGQVKNLYGNIVTGNWGKAVRDGHGLLDTILGFFGFDYPVDPLSPINTIMPVENLAIVRGKSRAQRLCLDPYSMHKLEDDVAGESMDAMNLKHILQFPMLIKQFSFQATSPIESLLFSTYVHPSISPQISTNTVNDVEYPVIQPTYLAFVSNAFSYWTGGMKFDIEVVATRFHTGRLLFAYWPNTDRAPSYQEALQLPNVIVDIQQTSHFTFTVPYTSSTAMKSTTLNLDSTGNLVAGRAVDSANGIMVCYVQNLLTHPGSVSPDVQINIYAYGDEDFNFFVMRRPYINMLQTTPPNVEATSGISIESDAVSPSNTSVYLSKDQDHSKTRVVFGESYTLIDLIRRYSFFDIFNVSIPNDTFPSTVIPVTPLNLSDSFRGDYKRTSMLQYWSSIYTTWAGSIRYKFVFSEPRTSNNLAIVTHYPDVLSSDLLEQEYESADAQFAANGYGSHLTTLSQNNSLEVDVPWYSRYNMLLIRPSEAIPAVSNTLYTINGYIRLFVNNNTNNPGNTPETALNTFVYTAAGEDFRFVYLRPPPPNQILTTMYYFPIST